MTGRKCPAKGVTVYCQGLLDGTCICYSNRNQFLIIALKGVVGVDRGLWSGCNKGQAQELKSMLCDFLV